MICICGAANCQIPYGTCHCGCGTITTINPLNVPSRGLVRGTPSKFILGHRSRPLRTTLVQPTDASIRHIPLTLEQHAIVSVVDYEWLMQWTWYAHWNPGTGTYYAFRTLRAREIKPPGFEGGRIGMHAAIVRPRIGYVADHIYGNTLDNRRSELRELSRQENLLNCKLSVANTSGFKGVYWSNAAQKWQAYIKVNGKSLYLGIFVKLEDAVAARVAAEERYYPHCRRRHY